MNIHHFYGDDFAATLRQCKVLHTHTEPSMGVMTHTAEYQGRDALLTELPGGLGGTLVERAGPGEVGQHEMARDALMRGLIDPPQQPATRPAAHVEGHGGHLALSDVPQDAVDALNRVHYVSADIWADELMRTRIIQTDHPDGQAIAHTGVRDDGEPIVLVQSGNLFIIFMPMQEP